MSRPLPCIRDKESMLGSHQHMAELMLWEALQQMKSGA